MERISLYRRVSALVPKNVFGWLEQQLVYANIRIEKKSFAGFIILFSLGLGLAVAINAFAFFGLPFFPTLILVFFSINAVVFYWLYMVSESKARFVEKILPDVLQLISSNIKAGLTVEKALFASARKEFGPLEKELRNASRKIYSGQPTIKVLEELPKKINSKMFTTTIELLVEGIRAGGQMSDLLIQLAEDLREEMSLNREIRANVVIYVIMIFLTASLGAPILFGLSSSIVGVLQEQTTAINFPTEIMEDAPQAPPYLEGIRKLLVPSEEDEGITKESVEVFSIIMLIMTSIFSGLILGVIQSGKEKDGLKFIPFIAIISLAVFYIVRFVIETTVLKGIII